MVNQAFSVREASCSFFSFVQKATTQLTHDLIRFISSPPEGAQTQFFFISLSKPGLRSREESKVFGWSRSRIPNNTKSQSRIFLSDSRCPIGSFFTSLS